MNDEENESLKRKLRDFYIVGGKNDPNVKVNDGDLETHEETIASLQRDNQKLLDALSVIKHLIVALEARLEA